MKEKVPVDLYDIVRRQLGSLEQWAGLNVETSELLNTIFEILTSEALQRPAIPPFTGLAQINPNGLPFQWSLCIDNKSPSLRFLCEAGVPGTSCKSRYRLSLEKLQEVCSLLNIPKLNWLNSLLRHAMPREYEWPKDWFSALWLAIGANQAGILVKIYLNIDAGDAFDRWKKIGMVLQSLGRQVSLQRLCDLSGKISRDSWPSGLAIDVLPNGMPGRVKAYFESAQVRYGWLTKWFKAVGLDDSIPYVEKMLDSFPYEKRASYPEKAFFISLEFLPGELMGLKADISVSQWMESDYRVFDAMNGFLHHIELDDSQYIPWLKAMDAWPPSKSRCTTHQLVGFGLEPDGTYHVNVYCQPPI